MTTLAELKDLKLGAPVGTTSLEVIKDVVQPTAGAGGLRRPRPALIKDLKNGQIDGVVVDFPTRSTATRIIVVGQFPPINGEQEQFGLAFEKGSPLVACVNLAIEALKANGTLTRSRTTGCQTDANVPVF